MRASAIALLVFLLAAVAVPARAAAESSSPPDPAAGTPAALENVIRWSTASEIENFGYDVFRGPSQGGPFARINPSPIPGHGTSDVPRKYEYRDTAIAPDTAYWYYVESISLQGDREKFTPVFQSRPKPAR